MNTEEGVGWEVADDIARIVLKRPERANAIGLKSSRALVHAIEDVLQRKPRAILLTGEGRVFCAGGDIEEFVAAGEGLPDLVDDILEPLHPAAAALDEPGTIGCGGERTGGRRRRGARLVRRLRARGRIDEAANRLCGHRAVA